MTADPRAQPFATEELQGRILNAVQTAQSVSLLKVGINEATKQTNRQHAQLIVIAADAKPIEIALTLPLVCEDKGVPYVFISSQEQLGKAAGLSRSATAVAILKGNQGVEKLIDEIEVL